MKRIAYIAMVYFILFFGNNHAVRAAELSVESIVSEVGVGQVFEISVVLDASEEAVQAVEGELSIPSILEISEIVYDASVVSFWLQEPQINTPATIKFSGLVTDTWRGEDGVIFTIIAESVGQGLVDVSFDEFKVVLDSDQGKQATTTVQPLTLRSAVDIPLVDFISRTDDSVPPEVFSPLVAYDETLFDGKYFLVFSTQDNESGIDRYEVLETDMDFPEGQPVVGQWQKAQSPYVLTDQSREQHTYVRAIDKAGNARTVHIRPNQKPVAYYQQETSEWIVYGLVGLGFFVLVGSSLVVVHRRNQNNFV